MDRRKSKNSLNKQNLIPTEMSPLVLTAFLYLVEPANSRKMRHLLFYSRDTLVMTRCKRIKN